MKYFIFSLLFLLLAIQSAFSQSILVEYYFSMKNIERGAPDGSSERATEKYIMNDTLSVQIPFNYTKEEQSTKRDKKVHLIFLKDKKRGFIYSPYEEPYFFKEKQYVKDSIPDFSWELLPDTMTILQQKCFAAKTHFRGRDYVAFYAPSIPLSDGPWKFSGLPGLILKVSSLDDDKVNWIAERLETNYKGEIPIPDIAEYTNLTWGDFVRVYADGFKRYGKYVRSTRPETEGFKLSLMIPSVEIIYPGLHSGVGAEF